jgi:hypothetical protein
MWWTNTTGSIELKITKKQALTVSHSGDCELDAKALAIQLKKQLDKLNPETVKQTLSEYGAWEEKDLQDNELNLLRLVWIAGCDIAEKKSLKNVRNIKTSLSSIKPST